MAQTKCLTYRSAAHLQASPMVAQSDFKTAAIFDVMEKEIQQVRIIVLAL